MFEGKKFCGWMRPNMMNSMSEINLAALIMVTWMLDQGGVE